MPSVKEFQAWDYVVFIALLLVSAAIGVFYAIHGGRQKTTEEFLMADRNLHVVPVSLSILLSFLSAILVLGTPAEMYTAGTQYYIYTLGMILGAVLAAVLFVPLLYPLQLTSSFEYLENRFQSKAAKLTGIIIMMVQMIIHTGIACFAPSTALEAVTGFPEWATIITVALLATFYTTLGGMKAVVWTDALQGLVMIAGLLVIVIEGVKAVGGVSEVWRLNDQWGRLELFDFNPDPTQRHTFWSLVGGGICAWTYFFGTSQASLQRYGAVRTLTKAKMTVYLTIIGIIVTMTLVCACGVIVFAYYATTGCDPLTAKTISNSNQLMPLFVMEVLGYPGLPGLFVSTLFSGSLSSVSSYLNSLAAVTWEDFLKPTVGHRLSESQKTLVTKILVVVFGLTGIGMAFMAKNLGGTVLQAAQSFAGASGGPLLGIFLLGSLFPWSNWLGCVAGGVVGLFLPMWISIGAYSLPRQPGRLLFPTENCSLINVTLPGAVFNATLAPTSNIQETGLARLYRVSYALNPAVGVGTSVFVGLLVSLITGPRKKQKVDPRYMIPIFDRLCCCLPESIRRHCRCGIDFPASKACRNDLSANHVCANEFPANEDTDPRRKNSIDNKKQEEMTNGCSCSRSINALAGLPLSAINGNESQASEGLSRTYITRL